MIWYSKSRVRSGSESAYVSVRCGREDSHFRNADAGCEYKEEMHDLCMQHAAAVGVVCWTTEVEAPAAVVMFYGGSGGGGRGAMTSSSAGLSDTAFILKSDTQMYVYIIQNMMMMLNRCTRILFKRCNCQIPSLVCVDTQKW